MVIDTSAIVAIALNEPEAIHLERLIADDPVRFISPATVLEAAMVIETRLGEAGGGELDLWLHKTGIEIVSVDAHHADLARRAWRPTGKAGMRPGSISAIVSPTHWRSGRARSFSSKEMIYKDRRAARLSDSRAKASINSPKATASPERAKRCGAHGHA